MCVTGCFSAHVALDLGDQLHQPTASHSGVFRVCVEILLHRENNFGKWAALWVEGEAPPLQRVLDKQGVIW